MLALCLALPAAAQTPPPAQPAPTQPPPKAAQPAKPRPPRAPASDAAASRGLVLTVQVTNTFGASLDNVRVTAAGPVARDGVTDQGGLVRFAGMRPGEYRLHLEKEGQVTLEKDVTLAAGKSIAVDATMNEAPKPPPPPPAPEPSATPTGPVGEPKVLSLSDFIEKNLIAREPMKLSTIGCSGVQRSVLLQVRDPVAEQTDDQLDQTLYVVAGQGTLKLGGREHPLNASSFAVIPRGTPYALARGRGNTPLIVLLSRVNEPCGAAAAATGK
jgi:mannose-6-phosphate isomerase-like protein (cupin superfamily)